MPPQPNSLSDQCLTTMGRVAEPRLFLETEKPGIQMDPQPTEAGGCRSHTMRWVKQRFK